MIVVFCGPPAEMAKIWSNTCQVPITPRVSTKKIVGFIKGTMIRRNRWTPVAPSTAAASSSEGEML